MTMNRQSQIGRRVIISVIFLQTIWSAAKYVLAVANNYYKGIKTQIPQSNFTSVFSLLNRFGLPWGKRLSRLARPDLQFLGTGKIRFNIALNNDNHMAKRNAKL